MPGGPAFLKDPGIAVVEHDADEWWLVAVAPAVLVVVVLECRWEFFMARWWL